jgi:hypothetical protein
MKRLSDEVAAELCKALCFADAGLDKIYPENLSVWVGNVVKIKDGFKVYFGAAYCSRANVASGELFDSRLPDTVFFPDKNLLHQIEYTCFSKKDQVESLGISSLTRLEDGVSTYIVHQMRNDDIIGHIAVRTNGVVGEGFKLVDAEHAILKFFARNLF